MFNTVKNPHNARVPRKKGINCFPLRIKETFVTDKNFSFSPRSRKNMNPCKKKQILPKRLLKKDSYCSSAVPPYTVDRIPFSPVFSIPRQSSCIIDRESPANTVCLAGVGENIFLSAGCRNKKKFGNSKDAGLAAYLSWINRFLRMSLCATCTCRKRIFFLRFFSTFSAKRQRRRTGQIRPNCDIRAGSSPPSFSPFA